MSPRSQTIIVALAIVAAFVLFWFHRDGGPMFLTLIGGSPIAAAVNVVAAAKKAATEPTAAQDSADSPITTGSNP